MPKKRTFYSEEERKAHHEKKQREADLQIQELTKHSPKFAEWMRQISKKSIQQSSENTLTKEEIIHDFEQIATQNRAEIRQEQHEEFEITML